MSAKAQALKSPGRDILSLSIGEPDFATPTHIGNAGKQAIDEEFTHYTAGPGIIELRGAVAGYFRAQYGVTAAAENVIISNGGKQALYNCFVALLDPGDEVLIPAPYWVSYPAMVELAGAVPVIAPSSVESRFKVTPEDLDRHHTKKTKVLVINSPSNPSGACYDKAELDAVARWALDRNVIVVSDEIYDQLVYAPAEKVSFSPWWQKHPEHFVIVGGVSKSFAMTGWRLGHALAAPQLIKAMATFQEQTTSNVCSITQKAALAAYTGDFAPVEAMRRAFLRRRDLAVSIISTWKDVVCHVPEGAFYIFPDMHRLYTDKRPDSLAMCGQLLEHAGVALVPGGPFGEDRCVRISYAAADDVLVKALERVAAFLYAK
jgi:aspartate aminotransferase